MLDNWIVNFILMRSYLVTKWLACTLFSKTYWPWAVIEMECYTCHVYFQIWQSVLWNTGLGKRNAHYLKESMFPKWLRERSINETLIFNVIVPKDSRYDGVKWRNHKSREFIHIVFLSVYSFLEGVAPGFMSKLVGITFAVIGCM